MKLLMLKCRVTLERILGWVGGIHKAMAVLHAKYVCHPITIPPFELGSTAVTCWKCFCACRPPSMSQSLFSSKMMSTAMCVLGLLAEFNKEVDPLQLDNLQCASNEQYAQCAAYAASVSLERVLTMKRSPRRRCAMLFIQ